MGGILVDTAPPKSLVVVETDYSAGAWMMAQTIDGARPDVALLVSGLSTSSWHWKALARHPLFHHRPTLRDGSLSTTGRDLWNAYVDAAVRRGSGKVAILSEGDEPLHGLGVVAGPYLLAAFTETQTGESRCAACVAERLARHVGTEAFDGPAGDHDAAHAVFRHYEV